MPIVGLVLTQIDAKKKEEATGPVKINNNINIGEVKEGNVGAINKKGLTIVFEYKADYINNKNKQFAEIFISGEILYLDDNHEAIIKGWKKDKKLPEDLNIQISNTILRKCTIQALELSEELQLPPPIPIPQASKKQQEDSRYIG